MGSFNMDAPTEEREHFGAFPRKPCRTCTDFKTWMKMSGPKQPGKEDKKPSQSASVSKAEHTAEVLSGCPLDKNELGRNSWSLLHTTAAVYPDKPNQGQQEDMKQFISLFSRLYPCTYCAEDFQKDIAEHPPKVETRSALSRWFCDRHNTVNRKLGKPEFDCDLVDERWRDGWKDGSCG